MKEGFSIASYNNLTLYNCQTDPEMTPRQKIVSTGYSFMDQDSYSLNGYESSPGNGLNADMVDGKHNLR